MEKEQFFSLDFNKTRQVKVTTNSDSEELRLYANGVEYSLNRKTGKYVGCGIDSAHSYMGWIVDAITRQEIKNKVDVTEWPSDVKNAFMETITLSLWDSEDKYFTTPADMSIGLEKLIRNALPQRKDAENEIIRHTHGNDIDVIERIRYHLRRAMPISVLINKGSHWVTIVGMICKYKADGSIDIDNTKITYIDLTSGITDSYPYKNLKILGWGDNFKEEAGHFFKSSWVKGTLVGLKSDSVLSNYNWTSGWNGKIFEANNRQFLFLIKESTGEVHIHNMNSDASVGTQVINYNWSEGWTNCEFYTIKAQTYLIIMKAGSNGLVRIHKMNIDGTVGHMIDEHDWDKGWFNMDFFSFKKKNYLLINKNSGETHIHQVNDNGTIGDCILEQKINPNSQQSEFFNTSKLKTIELNNRLYIYTLGYEKKNTILYQYELCIENEKYSIVNISNKIFSKNWTILEIFKYSDTKATILLDVGGDTLLRDGLMNLWDLNSSDGSLTNLIDENHFTNRYISNQSSQGNTTKPSQGWSSIQYFKSKSSKIKLFLIDAYSGNVQILNMNDDSSFVKNISPSQQLNYYNVAIKTGSIENAGTDANVFLQMKGTSPSVWTSRRYPIDTIYNDFEKGSLTEFNIVVDKYFGELGDIIVEHDNTGNQPGWYLEEIKITENKGNSWTFSCKKWLASSVGDGLTKRVFKQKYYDVVFKTGNIDNAGTDAKVYVQLKGQNATSSITRVDTEENDFERNSLTIERIFADDYFGEIQELIVQHDNSGDKPGWYLENVEVYEGVTNKRWLFPCQNWLSTDVGDRKIKRTLTSEIHAYDVKIKTGSLDNAGTDANVFIILKGTQGTSNIFLIDSSINDFEKNGTTSQRLITEKSLGELKEIIVYHDNSGENPGWFLEYITVTENKTNKTVKFPCYNWLALNVGDKKIRRELTPDLFYYDVKLKTSNIDNAGTDANVFIAIKHTKNDIVAYTDRFLINSSKDDFERNSITLQRIIVKEPLGEITNVFVSHDNSGDKPGWHLEEVIITDYNGKTLHFPCNNWLAETVGDKKIARELSLEAKYYEIKIKTGNVAKAGTDANVFIQLSGKISKGLKYKIDTKGNDFEKNSLTVQKFYVDEYLGDLSEVIIEHDNKGDGAGWFVDYVQIKETTTGKEWKFTCNQWLAKTVGDKKIKRTLKAD